MGSVWVDTGDMARVTQIHHRYTGILLEEYTCIPVVANYRVDWVLITCLDLFGHILVKYGGCGW